MKRKIIGMFVCMLLISTTIFSVEGIANKELTSLSFYRFGSTSITWNATLNFSEPSGKNDYVVFGEAPDANDGPPADSYDAPKPPLPMPPYLRAWFDDGLSSPYQDLWQDYRMYPDTYKVWDLYVKWGSSDATPININMTWDVSEFIGIEYEYVILNRYNRSTEEWNFAADMLTENCYTYAPEYVSEQWITDHFQINAYVNRAPYIPSSPNPVDGATDVDVDAVLSWSGGDPDGDTVTYDVYFGTNSSPHQVIWNQSTTLYNPGTMNYNFQYYWKIVAWDNHGISAEGPIWNFTTQAQPNDPPYMPSNPFPGSHSIGIGINASLSWSGGDPDGDMVLCDVYFGKSSSPCKVVGNQSATTYDPGILDYETIYYWQIVAWDSHGASTTGPIWDFTTKSSDGGTGPGQNNPPIADANGPYTQVTGTPSLFNGSGSNDSDGTITNYTWHFGDGTMGYKAVTSHIYTESGNYTVTLTVTDDGGKKGSDMTYASVTTVSSLLPSIPAVDGITKGKVTVDYSYTAVSTDPNNNAIRYIFEWGDNTNITMSPFMASGTDCNIIHKWSNSGMYIVTVYAENEKHVTSGIARLTVFIDVEVQFIDDMIKGYIVDNNNDGIYDIFHNDTSGSETSVEKHDGGGYLIDSNGDSTWDYIYSIETGILEAYPSSGGNISGNTQQDNPVSIWVILLPVSFVTFIVAGILIFTYGVKKQKKEKQDASEKEKMEVEKRKKSE